MKRPEIRLENYEAVYRYYRDHQPLTPTAKLGYFLMAKGMAPEVSYEDGAEEEIRDHLAMGGLLMMSPNHVSDLDQYTVAGLASSEPVLRPLQTETFVLAKPDVFTASHLQRIGVDTMGAIPVWRAKDTDDDQRLKAIRGEAGEMLADVCHHRIVDLGNHGALFGEGTRNKTNPDKVQEFKHGISNTLRTAQDVHMLALPIGIRYPISDAKIKRHPRVHIGRPLRTVPQTPKESVRFTQELQQAVQKCVDATALPKAA